MAFRDVTMEYFHQMLDYRKSVGFATATYECSVPPFIEYSAENHPDAQFITKNMVDEWLEHYDFQTNSTQAVFIAMLERGSNTIQTQFKIPASAADVLIGIILFFMLGCEFFINYRLIVRGKEEKNA